MSKSLKAAWVSLLGLFVGAALFIGTQSAFAKSVALDCVNNGSSLLGSCLDTPDCQQKCDQVHGAGQSTGICSGTPGCCRCLF
jgi:hypothetical protein